MDSTRRVEPPVDELQAPGGERARVEGDELCLLNSHGEVVARYAESVGLRIVAETGNLTLAAPQGAVIIEAERIEMKAAQWRTRVEHVQHMAGRLEVRAQRVVETAVDVYRTCEGLMQLRAERARSLIEGAYEVIAHQATITSEEETKIDGKRVLLG